MRTAGSFTKLEVTPKELVVGATTDYEVKLTAAIPIFNKDFLVIDFPSGIGTPGGEANFCEPPPAGQSTCVASVYCSSARGSITVEIQTKSGCSKTGAVFAFTIKGVRNARSMVPTEIKTAHIKSFEQQAVAVYSGSPIVIQCNKPDALDPAKVKVEQTSRDFGADALYTIRFTPTNPITQMAWVKVTYPTSVEIVDSDEFLKGCSIQTTLSCGDCCKLDETNRIIWFYRAFVGQGGFTSEVSMEFPMRNPVTNFGDVTPAGYTKE